MTYPSIKNLRSNTVFQFDPTSWTANYPDLQSKTAFRQWCQNPVTDHAFISGVEGVNGHVRVGAENPPHKITALVLDYDVPPDWASLKDDLLKRLGGTPLPTWAVETWSGNMRLIWELDEPVLVNEHTAGAVLEELAKTVKSTKLYAGYDNTSTNPSQYFEAGRKWVSFGGSLSSESALLAVYKAGSGKQVLTDVTIPLEDIKAEIDSRWPGRWSGDFAPGARGPLFWIDDGVDRHGAIVREEGMVCFSDRAGSPFVNWREIFGSDFVKNYETKKISSGVKDIYYDGRDFWLVSASGAQKHNRENISLHLRVSGFSSEKKKGQLVSDVDAALHYIVTTNRVDGAAPYVFRSDYIVRERDGRKIINTSRSKALEPADNGDPSNWPWLNNFFSLFFDPVADELGCQPLDFWYAWLSRSYQAALQKSELSGHAVIIAGAPRRGKTLLSQFIVGNLLGGFADAADYLAAKTTFNKALSEVPVWTIDDSVSATSFADHRKFVEVLKKLVANPRIQVEQKYCDRVDIPWFGRAIITLNEDANSLSMIPNLESSNRDKLMAFRISDNSFTNFLPNHQQEALILRELPFFARWLLDYQTNPAVIGPARYGVRSYFHPLVENSARDSSTRQGSTELLDIFLRYYAEANPGISEWTGTTTDLMVAINRIDELRYLPLMKDPMRLQRDLSSAEEYSKANPQLRGIRSTSTGSGRVWKIQVNTGCTHP